MVEFECVESSQFEDSRRAVGHPSIAHPEVIVKPLPPYLIALAEHTTRDLANVVACSTVIVVPQEVGATTRAEGQTGTWVRHTGTVGADFALPADIAAGATIERVGLQVHARIPTPAPSALLAEAPGADLTRRALHAAGATVGSVEVEIDATVAALRLPGSTRATSAEAIRSPFRTDVAARTAVLGVLRAYAVAYDGPFDAVVFAVAVDACTVLIRTGVGAAVAARAAVVEIAGKICAEAVAAGGPRAAAGVPAGASAAQAARGVIAGSTGGKALTSRRPFGTSVAEGLARVLRRRLLAGRPGSPRRERAQHRPGEDGAQTAQRFAARY